MTARAWHIVSFGPTVCEPLQFHLLSEPTCEFTAHKGGDVAPCHTFLAEVERQRL